MKNQWNRKKRLKPLHSSKANRSRTARGLTAGGKGMGEGRDLQAIIELVLKDIVDQGGTISLSMDDGKLHISGAASDEFYGEESDKEDAR